MEYRDALNLLWERSAYERGLVADPFGGAEAGHRGLARTAAMLDRLGAPHRRLGILHVAGSKGKGSTAALAAAVLTAAGHRTGLYTSPHLHSFRERMVVDGEPPTPAAFGRLAAVVDRAARAVEAAMPHLGQVTTFELLTAMGFLRFAEAACAVAVVEVGLGGEWDATNVVDPIVSAIARIDREHTAVLGSTLAAIAGAKAGIIKPGRPVVVAPQADGVVAVFAARAKAAASPLLVGGRDWRTGGTWRNFAAVGPWGSVTNLRSALAGAHQLDNAGLAIAALWWMNAAGFATEETAVRTGLATVRWPGRFEQVARANHPPLVLDGAHTPAAAGALARTLAETHPGRRATAVVGLAADKDADDFFAALAPVVGRVVATRAASPRAAAPADVAAAAGRQGLPAATAPSVAAALAAARRAGDELILVTGSLYVVGEAREALNLAEPDPPWGPPNASNGERMG